MKYRKHIAILLIVTMLLLITGCGEKKNDENAYKVFAIGGCDEVDGGQHVDELATWSSEARTLHQDPTAPNQATVMFNGVTYTGFYDCSNVIFPDLYKSHEYRGNDACFSINAETGELTSILLLNQKRLDEATVDKEYCRKLADSIADDYVDLKDYQVKVEIRELMKANYGYTFRYYRQISGFIAGDYFSITVDGNGNLVNFGMTMLGSFADVKSVSVDNAKANDAVKAKLDTIYTGKAALKEYEMDNVMIIKLEDGSCAVLYNVDLENSWGHRKLQLVVTVDHEKR